MPPVQQQQDAERLRSLGGRIARGARFVGVRSWRGMRPAAGEAETLADLARCDGPGRSFKFQKRAGCVYRGHRAVYLGPYVSVMDEEGHLFPRGQAIEVCTDTLAKLSHQPYLGSFVLLEPGVAIPEAYSVACGPGCC